LVQAISNSHFAEEHALHPSPGRFFLGAQASRLLRKQARRLRSQEKTLITGGVLTKQTSK